MLLKLVSHPISVLLGSELIREKFAIDVKSYRYRDTLKLPFLNVGNNSLVCNCSNAWMMEPRYEMVIVLSDYPCATPDKMRNIHRRHLTRQRLECGKLQMLLCSFKNVAILNKRIVPF